MAGSLRQVQRHKILENHHSQPQGNPGVSTMNADKMQFDSEEIQILQDFEHGEFQSIPNLEKEKQALEESARDTLKKNKRINIRISSRDLKRLQMRAAREGIPYQTYISSTLHKLVAGRMKEIV
jgi:predicted DNA binding CopG/RHH family protein